MRGQLRSEQREAALDYRRTDRSVCGLARSSCVATSISSVSANQGSESGLRLRMFSVVATERTRAEWTLGKARAHLAKPLGAGSRARYAKDASVLCRSPVEEV